MFFEVGQWYGDIFCPLRDRSFIVGLHYRAFFGGRRLTVGLGLIAVTLGKREGPLVVPLQGDHSH